MRFRCLPSLAFCVLLLSCKTTPETNSEEKIGLGGIAPGPIICPGALIVQSCGDLTCNSWKGETAETCPSDCAKYGAASYNFQQICEKSDKLSSPASSEELQKQVLDAIAQGRRVKVVGRLHSTNNVICNDGVLISTQKLETIHGIETYNGIETVKLQSGVTMGQLTDWLHTKGKALGYTLMGFRGLSVAGAIGTGAHGSSPIHTSVISALVESMEMLEANGKIVEYNRRDADPKVWKALTTHLGMLGAVLNVRLRIREQFALQTTVDFMSQDELLTKQGNWSLVRDCDFGQMVWFPGAKKVMRMCGKEQALDKAKLDPGARIAFVDLAVSDWIFPIAKAVVHSSACNFKTGCLIENTRANGLQKNPPLKIADGSKEKNVVSATGYSHKMMSGDLSDQGMGYYQNDWAVAIPVSRLDEALRAMQASFESYKMCLPFAGIFIRYGQSAPISWLAHSASGDGFKNGEAVAFLDMVVYNPVGYTNALKAELEIPQGEIIKMLLYRFGARLHWGKNKDWALAYGVKHKAFATNLEAFREVVQKMDPYGVFANATGEIVHADWPKRGQDFSKSATAN